MTPKLKLVNVNTADESADSSNGTLRDGDVNIGTKVLKEFVYTWSETKRYSGSSRFLFRFFTIYKSIIRYGTSINLCL